MPSKLVEFAGIGVAIVVDSSSICMLLQLLLEVLLEVLLDWETCGSDITTSGNPVCGLSLIPWSHNDCRAHVVGCYIVGCVRVVLYTVVVG